VTAVRAVAVVMDAGRILVNEQHEALARGMVLAFPGGTPHPGEALEACAGRVVKEHFGLALQVKRLVYVHEHLWRQGDADHHEVALFFLGGIKGGVETDPEGNVHARDPKLHPRLVALEGLDPERLFPPFLRRELPRDLRTGFREGVRHFVDGPRTDDR